MMTVLQMWEMCLANKCFTYMDMHMHALGPTPSHTRLRCCRPVLQQQGLNGSRKNVLPDESAVKGKQLA